MFVRPATPSHKHGQYCFGSAGWVEEKKKKTQVQRKSVPKSTFFSGRGGFRSKSLQNPWDEMKVFWMKVSEDETVFGRECILPLCSLGTMPYALCNPNFGLTSVFLHFSMTFTWSAGLNGFLRSTNSWRRIGSVASQPHSDPCR